MLIIAAFYPTYAIAQSLNSTVKYEARDSIVANIPEQKVRLYGLAKVEFEDIELTADFIEVDLKKSEVAATYTLDSLGQPVGKPVFTSDGEESRCDYIKYNFNTKKGYVKEIRATQGDGYIHMAESTIHANEQVHLKDGKYTTCDADTPHYHFKLTRAIIVPDERIVTGPVYMKIFKIPTPLAAPFAFFPNSDSKKHGIIIPRIANTNQYGFGLQDFGYYIPLGDYWETYFYATIFTTGRFGLQNMSNYYKKYKYTGNLGLKFEQFRGKFYDTIVTNKWTFNWRHTQDAKAHPSLKFSTDINFKSDNNGKSSLEAINPEYFDNQFNSSANLTKTWRTTNFSGTMGLKTSLQQNSQSKNYTLELPTYNLSVNRFDLGVLRSSTIGKKWYENINVTYSMNARNYIAAPDSLFKRENLYLVSDYALNGVQHNTVVQSNLRAFGGRVMFAPTINYKEFWNFQYEKNEWNPNSEKIDTVELSGFKASRELSFSAGASSNFFGYYKFAGPSKVKFRHVASPAISFSYRPDIGLYEEIVQDTLGGTKYYSPFQNSLYKEAGRGDAGVIGFSLANTLEMKRRDKKDTVNQSMLSNKLVDAFSISTSYNILADSFNLSPINFAFRTARFLKVFSFQSGAVLSPYSFNTFSGVESKEYAWNTSQGVGRIKTANATVNANFTNPKGRKKQKEISEGTQNNAQDNNVATNPNITSFEIPWQLNLSYNYNYKRLTASSGGVLIDTTNLVQTIRADGDFNLNQKWKFGYGINFDLQAVENSKIITNYNFTIWRDLHCWEASLQWMQYGPWKGKETNATFLFRINIKAAMFQDIKLEYTKPPFFF